MDRVKIASLFSLEFFETFYLIYFILMVWELSHGLMDGWVGPLLGQFFILFVDQFSWVLKLDDQLAIEKNILNDKFYNFYFYLIWLCELSIAQIN